MSLWENDMIQFARLITELQLAGAFTAEMLNRLSEQMDLELNDIYEIIERAQITFDKSVSEV